MTEFVKDFTMYAKSNNSRPVVVSCDEINTLLVSLAKSGYQNIGPTIRDNAIVYNQIDSIDDLPIGWIDSQDNGYYRLEENNRPALFDYVVGQHSWKEFLHLPVRDVITAARNDKNLEIGQCQETPSRRALIGVRACELQALQIQDKILLEGPYTDTGYQVMRQNLFIVAVNCVRSGGTCFCTSMNTGPGVSGNFDLALTEIIDGNSHYFVVDIGSQAGQDILKKVPTHIASDKEKMAAEKAVEQAAANMGRHLDTDDLKELLERNFDNIHWEEVAKECLTCGNCTLVCPTCFCTNIEDETDLTGGTAIRRRMWDSCFTVGFSYIHGGSIRSTETSRYRQWLMHKLCYWVDQFGSFGCVGCGRCITWCPVGLDITKEVPLIRESETT